MIDWSSMTLGELENLFTEHSTDVSVNRSRMTKEEMLEKSRLIREVSIQINDRKKRAYKPSPGMPPGYEPEGYSCEPGYLKSNPENNDFYLSKLVDWNWYPAIEQCHKTLNYLIPGYNISQIKTKFGRLCFYFNFPEEITVHSSPALDTVAKVKNAAWNAVLVAESWVEGYEAARRDFVDSDTSYTEESEMGA